MTTTPAFCIECGAQNLVGDQFCSLCGVAMTKVQDIKVEESSILTTNRDAEPVNTSLKLILMNRKISMLLAAAVLISFVVGVGLASENVLSPIIGRHYSEKRLENEKKQSREIGYKAGETAGYNSGYENGESNGFATGLSTGEINGCNKVFDKAGSDNVIGIFYPFRSFNLGDFYWKRSDVC